MLINEATRDFIRRHADDDVRRLALQGAKDAEVDLPLALQQIAGRQTARRKLPSWAEVEGIIYPPHLNMEQCSSEQTARYKASLVRRLLASSTLPSSVFVDLTGGFGVDFYWMSQGFQQRTYIEQNAELCAMAEHNFKELGLDCNVCCCTTATYLQQMPHAHVVYLDPARRDEHGARTYGIADCSPNVLDLLPLLLEKADCLILKLSPMLDWRKAVEDIRQQTDPLRGSQTSVSEVHIVSVANECKELLLVVENQRYTDLLLSCVNLGATIAEFSYRLTASQSVTDDPSVGTRFPVSWSSTSFLYEPNASVMKAGCFAALEERFPVRQVAPNSHLFLSAAEVEGFPGRGFHIEAVSSMNKRDLIQLTTPLRRANISVRNFPLSADQLRKKLKLQDGGDAYIFATTAANGEHKLFICRKIR